MKKNYVDLVLSAERLFRIFLDVMKNELKEFNVSDLSNIQALILYNIGKDKLTVGDIMNRRYYLGSNVSYNLKKMMENKYIEQKRSEYDRRTIYIYLTEKGLNLFRQLEKAIVQHMQQFEKEKLNDDKLGHLETDIRSMEKCLNHILEA